MNESKAEHDGAIYVATGPDYRALALQSAKTLKAHNPALEVDLFTDDTNAIGLDVFDRILPVPRVHDRAKLECFALSRFTRTLYLDCDTLVLRPLDELFTVADRFELALAHDVRRKSALVREGFAEKTPYAFPQLNSGVLLYRKTEAMLSFFKEWRQRFHAHPEIPRDQVFLKDLLWASNLRFYVLPQEFNLRRLTMLDAWEPLDACPTIIHSHRLLDHLRKKGAPQIRDAETILRLEREALIEEWRLACNGQTPEDIGLKSLKQDLPD